MAICYFVSSNVHSYTYTTLKQIIGSHGFDFNLFYKVLGDPRAKHMRLLFYMKFLKNIGKKKKHFLFN